MKSTCSWLAGMAILIMGGCAADETTLPPQAESPPQGSDVVASVAQLETDVSTSAPEQQASEQPAEEPQASAPQDDTPGLSVGTKAPAFELQDQDGKSRTLASLLESGSTALVFYRSADW